MVKAVVVNSGNSAGDGRKSAQNSGRGFHFDIDAEVLLIELHRQTEQRFWFLYTKELFLVRRNKGEVSLTVFMTRGRYWLVEAYVAAILCFAQVSLLTFSVTHVFPSSRHAFSYVYDRWIVFIKIDG